MGKQSLLDLCILRRTSERAVPLEDSFYIEQWFEALNGLYLNKFEQKRLPCARATLFAENIPTFKGENSLLVLPNSCVAIVQQSKQEHKWFTALVWGLQTTFIAIQ